MEQTRKAVAAFLSGAVGVVALFVPQIRDLLSAEVIMSTATLVTVALVYGVPNAMKGVNVADRAFRDMLREEDEAAGK